MKTKMNTKEKLKKFVLLSAVLMMLMFTGCGDKTAGDIAEDETAAVITADREGNPVRLPDKIEKIISLGPSNTEILVELGFADKIIATDDYSPNIGTGEMRVFSMMTPDAEQIITLQPDIIFVTGMSKSGGEDPFKSVADTGICIIYIPSSTSIDGIKEDIRYIAEVMGAEEKGEATVAGMEKEIEAIKRIGETIVNRKKVYFEISAAPYMYSSGGLTFLNEMIELIGAENIFGDQEIEWMSVADEAVLTADPDVILTSVNYIENPEDEIKARPGWSEIKAVKDNAVYYIDADASNRPSQNIIKAMKEMAKAVYPDKYNY